MRACLATLLALFGLLAPPALAQTQFVVGTEDLNFYPHYDFTGADSLPQ